MNSLHFHQSPASRLGRVLIAAALSVALVAPSVPVLASSSEVVSARQAADPQTSVAGGVTVKVSRLDSPDVLAFNVVLDTHSVNLDGYDLQQLAVLRTPSGEEIAPLAWEAPAGGHHREGTLTFPTVGGDGAPLLAPNGGQVLLVIRDIAGIAERTFGWTA